MIIPVKTLLEQLARATRALPTPVIIADADGCIFAMNDAALREYGDFAKDSNTMYSWPKRIQVYLQCGRRLKPEEYPLNRAVLGEMINGSYVSHRADGRVSHIRVIARPIIDSNSIVGAMSIHRLEDCASL